MNQKILISIALSILLLGIIFVYAMLGTEVGPLKMEKGWNLVYGFVTPYQFYSDFDITHDTPPESPIKAIYMLDPKTQKYFMTYPRFEANGVDAELQNTAFWVYSTESWETEYWLKASVIPFEQRTIYQGWNFIGITDDFFLKKLDDLKGNCNIEKSYIFKAQTQKWEVYSISETLNDNELKYSGWVIKVSSDCKLGTNEGTITPPPTLP